MLRSAYAQFVYLVGGADHDQMEKIRAFMSQLVEGWDVETVKEIVAETLHHVVDPIVYDEAVSLMEEHHRAGRDVVVVSASGTEVVEPIGEMLDADHVIASRLADRRRQVHRRDRLLRLRRGEGPRDRGDGRRARLRPRRLLRLQRLDHRRADARGGRPPPRRQPRPGAAQAGREQGLAGAAVHPPGHAAQPDPGEADARRPHRRYRAHASAARSGSTAAGGSARSSSPTRAPTRRGESQGL